MIYYVKILNYNLHMMFSET